jgi:hypothetical protein
MIIKTETSIKQEAIQFAEWLWTNVDEQIMSLHDWDYLYECYKNEINPTRL